MENRVEITLLSVPKDFSYLLTNSSRNLQNQQSSDYDAHYCKHQLKYTVLHSATKLQHTGFLSRLRDGTGGLDTSWPCIVCSKVSFEL